MKKSVLICVLCGWLAATAMAETEDEAVAAVASSMRAQWEKPGQPLVLPVIIVQDDVAIADWLLGKKGGRALLRLVHGQWHTVLCGGTELHHAQRLQQAGVSRAVAASLVAQLQVHEKRLTASQKQGIDGFQGVMDFSQTHGHKHEHGAQHGD